MVRAQARQHALTTTGLASAIVLSLVLLGAAARPAGAAVFHVTLSNGSVIDSLYEPQEASWDHGMVLVLTDAGNWIGVRKGELASVVSESATRGFGVVINTTTVSLGDAPNDQPVPNKDAGSRNQQALQSLLEQQQPKPNYTIQQGVQSEATQGIPSSFISPNGSNGPSAITPVFVPAPSPSASPQQ